MCILHLPLVPTEYAEYIQWYTEYWQIYNEAICAIVP